jgi:hypothetical protein
MARDGACGRRSVDFGYIVRMTARVVEPHFRVCGVQHGVMPRDRREKQQDRAAAWAGPVLIFVALGGWRLGRSTQARVAFLLISIPWSGVVFFFWFFGAMAK